MQRRRTKPIKFSTYYDAMWRHMMSCYENLEDIDPESGRMHMAHVVANALIIMDAMDCGTLIDDRSFSTTRAKS